MAHITRENAGKKPKTISELFTNKTFEFTFVSIFADMTIFLKLLNLSLPSSTDANVGAANGLADLQEFHGIDPSELINGQITNYVTGNQYFSKSKLSSNEALKIG